MMRQRNDIFLNQPNSLTDKINQLVKMSRCVERGYLRKFRFAFEGSNAFKTKAPEKQFVFRGLKYQLINC